MTVPRSLVFSPRAVNDLDDIADYISRDNPTRAATFIAEIEVQCRAVAAAPEHYRAREDLAPGLRMVAYGRYLVFFRDLPEHDTVRIERVLHSARNLRRLF